MLFGAGRRLDREQVHQAGHKYLGIPCHAAPKRIAEVMQFLHRNKRGTEKASEFIRGNHVDVVVGLGGYASVPSARRRGRQCSVPDEPLIL